jgi:transposase
MPTLPRRPAAQRERDRLQARRLRAAELFTAGMRQAEVARQLGVSALAVSVWHARWRAGGVEALHSRGPSGPGPRLSDQQLAEVEQALLKGATANGFTGELWTLERIGVVIERLTGVRHHPAWVWALLHHRLGWTVQRPSTGPPSATRRRSTAGSRNAGRGFCKRPTTQSLPGLLRRDRAQPDPQRVPDLGAQGPAANLDPPVQLQEGLDGGRALLRRPRWRRAALLARHARQLRHRHPHRGAQRVAPVPGVGSRPPCFGTGCPRIAAERCGPGWRPSGPGWWWSGYPPMRRS